MIVQSYSRELASIKTELSRYSHISTFNCALTHLDKNTKGVEGMPWIIMFLLKLSLQGRDGPLKMEAREFWSVANKIYHLSSKLLGPNNGSFMLMVRSMLNQQLWYQIGFIDSLRHVILQRALFERSFDTNNQLFLEKTGIGLDDYYKISFYLLTVAGKAESNRVVKWSLSCFYSHLSPALSDDVLIKFLRLVSITFPKLHDFMQGFVVEDSNSVELYQETPLKNKPIIIENEGLVIFNAGLCISGLRSIAMETLKACKPFSVKFGHDVEAYIGERLRITPMDVYSMSDLNGVIPVKVGQIADYVVVDGDELFIFESKAIIPTVLMKCVYDPDWLSRLLEECFIKGVEQGQETAFKLLASERFKGMKARIVVVTLEDFFVYGGEYLGSYIRPDLEKELKVTYGSLPVPMQDVIYMTLKDLNTLTEWLKDKPIGSLSALFRDVEEAEKQPGGSRFSLSQHINEKVGPDVIGAVGIGSTLEKTHDEMQELLGGNKRYWTSQHPVTYMRAFSRFRDQLLQSFE
ncbi:hypothetical protein [Pseudomonas sp. NFIX28]|uniref:hypothetical protein n=1 Tax=Pseudomonas sp. NFIX28 TaxID=1566235 RepID=UPI0008954103|nr:hypothetical protein [Pseudomonas sp. NFIX28]SDZ44858.1 hypothetical protein SAMN03159453_03872 [Pseudomonas sp. NFIX28]